MKRMMKVGAILAMLVAGFNELPNHAAKVYASSTTLPPTEDTYVMNGDSAGQNFGSEGIIHVSGSDTQGGIGYLKFNMSSFSSSVANKAILRLYVNSKTDGSSVSNVFGIAAENWDASTMTWNSGSPYHDASISSYPTIGDVINKYTPAYLLDRKVITSAGAYYEFDVSDYVNSQLAQNSDKTVAFLLSSSDNLDVNYASSEDSTNPPQLVIEDSAVSSNMIHKISDSILDSQVLNFSDPKFGLYPNMSGGSLVYYNGYQYTAYYDKNRYISVARRPSVGGPWETTELTDYYYSSNDTHNTVTLGISSDGAIHLAFDCHASDLHYRVTQPDVANNPGKVKWDASLFGPITDTIGGTALTDVTYPGFKSTPDGNMLLLYRTRGSGNGWREMATYTSATHSWKVNGKYITSSGSYTGTFSGTKTQRGSYPLGFVYDSNGRLHMPFVWRETPNALTNHDINYIYSDDNGATWYNQANVKVATTGSTFVNINSPDLIIDPIPEQRGLINGGVATVDSHNRLHLITQEMPSDAPDATNSTEQVKRNFYYWFDASGKLNKINLHFGGTVPKAMMAANDDVYIAYVSQNYTGKDTLRIAKATAASNYSDWKIIYQENDLPGLVQGLRLDDHQFKKDGIFSVEVEEAPATRGAPSAIHVMEYSVKDFKG